MDRVVVIANPVASQFTGGSHRDVMLLLDQRAEVEAVWPGSAAEAAERSREAAAEGTNIIVAMGGDGMVHHVAQGLVGTDSTLGVIPVGTTNVFARLLGIPTRPARAARLIADHQHVENIGVAELGLQRGSTESRYFAIFSCGLGLDAVVVQEADKEPYRKYRFGSLHYASTAVGVALRDFPRRRPNVTVTAGDHEAEATSVLVQFRSIYTYFGKIALRLAPGEPDPMTVLTLGRLRRHRIPNIVLSAFRGRDLKEVGGFDTWHSIDEVAFRADPPVEAQADGESLGMADGGAIVWVPWALRVVSGQRSP